MLRAVTVWPLVVKAAFHEPTMAWPAGRVKVTAHEVMVDVPVLVTVTGWTT
jgi:hypothetical protein